ncbi:hypothetical protein PCO86_19280 [Pectobacteriaceae bacterium CE70]|nr:hypothetical protein PCO87_20040 [Pectobacteriaceae bacterium C52]WJV66376.1 hypothetical protein PCO86_19280 [Pectobacteriaceae bacterium CE70]WJY10382.1 hypothetical protein PCO80_19240 [Pectobacteriaceae bacterium C80]
MGFLSRIVVHTVVIGILAFGNAVAFAGQLILKNMSSNPITCTVDGWTISSGSSFDWYIKVQPGQSFYVGQNTSRPNSPIINWANCNNLQTRSMTVTPSGPNQTLALNGQQTRVLNVSLYPYLPTLPTDDFENLVAYIVQTYQAQHPQVLLNAVLNQAVDIYSFDALPTLLGHEGFDVIELDVLYLGFLADNHLINPVQITGDAPWPVALAGSTYKDQLWGIPSWLCMDFIYDYNHEITTQKSLTQLITYLGTRSPDIPELVGSYNGSWSIPSDYINAYVQTYGFEALQQSMQMPPDEAVVKQLVTLSDTCEHNGINKCTNNTYHHAPNGTTEQVFATGQASTDMGFSEQSFFIQLYQSTHDPLYVTPTPWGEKPQPLLFQDSFVSSAATCSPGSNCAADAQAFTTLMTSVAMKNYIVQSKDLPAGSPWRTLLVANQQFWQQPLITDNAYYQQLRPIFATAQAFPNNFTEQVQTEMATQICTALKQQQPMFVCDSGTNTTLLAPSHSRLSSPQKSAQSRRGL